MTIVDTSWHMRQLYTSLHALLILVLKLVLKVVPKTWSMVNTQIHPAFHQQLSRVQAFILAWHVGV